MIGQTIGSAIAGGIAGRGDPRATAAGKSYNGSKQLTLHGDSPCDVGGQDRSFWQRVGDFFSDVGDFFATDGRLGFDHTRERRQAYVDSLRWPVGDEEEIIVTAPWQGGTGALEGYVPYVMRPESERQYASAGQPYTYWGNVGNQMQRGWNSAWSNFQHELGPATSINDAFRRGVDPMGTRYITATLNLAFQPIGNGVGGMLEPIMPDSDAEWLFIQQNREHPSIFDPQHVMTGQERRDLVGAGVVAVATWKLPVGRAGATSRVPPQLRAGIAAEPELVAAIGSSGKVPFTPTEAQVNSAAFRVIVGEPKYTPAGALEGTIYDGLTAGGLAEIKTGSSVLDSSYQLRLQTYGALVNDLPYTIYTSRPVNPTFDRYLTTWGVAVKPLPN